jgi:acetylglutamate kinase
MKALIKIGGTLLDAVDSRRRLAAEIARAVEGGWRAVVVHGGGKQMTRVLTERGVESRFVNGLRVTTPEVLDAVLKVLAGSVNQELVAAFIAAGARAVGLSGMDALLTEARRMSEERISAGGGVRSRRPGRALLQRERGPNGCVCGGGHRRGQAPISDGRRGRAGARECYLPHN